MVKARSDTEIPGAVAAVETSIPDASAGNVVEGSPTELNLDENPNFEENLLGVVVESGTFERSATKAKYGSYSCKIVQGLIYTVLYKFRLDLSKHPVTPGATYVHSIWVQMGSGDSGNVVVVVGWYDAEGALISGSQGAPIPIGDSTWVEAEVVGAAPANAVLARLYTVGSGASGSVYYFDGERFYVQNSYVPPPPVGSSIGAEVIPPAKSSLSRE